MLFNAVCSEGAGVKKIRECFIIHSLLYAINCAPTLPGRPPFLSQLAMTVEQRVAVTTRQLGSNIENRILAGMFGIGRSTACEIVNDTAKKQ